MPTYPFKQVDVFTTRAGWGNPVAVLLSADGLDTEAMLRLTRWTNLSEATFLLPPTTPDADYRLRIFTPGGELPFAGHPTIGSAYAALEAGIVHGVAFRQECGAGVLPLSVTETASGPRIAVLAPEAKLVRECGEVRDAIAAALGAPLPSKPEPAVMNNGQTWLFVCLPGGPDISALRPDMAALDRLGREHRFAGVAAFALLEGDAARIHIRCFAPAVGVPEDPVTGSANAALPAYLAHVGLLEKVGTKYLSTQGTEMGRDGRVYVRVLDDRGRAEIGGHAVTVIDGEIRL